MANLPKDFINNEIIDYLPIFIKTKFENILQSEAIFKLIYSYFENEEYSINHNLKIEKIIKLVFEISDNEVFKDRSTCETSKFHPIIRSYRLKEACSNERFYIPVANYCSNEVIYQIAQNLLKYLESEYMSSFQIQSLFYDDEEDRNSYSIQTIYTTFLKNCCVKIAYTSVTRINEIIKAFLGSDFGHKYFTKLGLYLISKTWKQSKHFFFELIEKQDRKMLFSSSYWGDDLYFFLEDIAPELTKNEASIIERIIENGSQNDEYYDKGRYLNDYKLRWYSALTVSPFLNNKYQALSKQLNKYKEEIKPQPKVYVTSGSVSPISKEDIYKLPVKELVDMLKTFDPKRSFRSPSVEGLACNITTIIGERPEFFYENYEHFLDVPYRYISSVFYGLPDAYNDEKIISLEKILNFSYKYTTQKGFGSDELQLKNASFKYDHLSVIESLCRFLSRVLRNDELVLSIDILNVIENILFNFLENYISIELNDKDKGKLGSAMHAINSTTGVIIGCIVDYSLRKGRLINNDINDKTPRWSVKEKNVYEGLIKKGVQEFYMYFGWHRGNFHFLDYEWTTNIIKTIPNKDVQTIKSYFGCHLINQYTTELDYKIFKDIYKKAINENWQVVDSTMGDEPLEFHATIFYIFDYENLNYDEVLTLLLDKKDIEIIRSIIHSLSFKYDKYYKKLNSDDKIFFKRKIYKVWEYTLSILDGIIHIEAKNMPTLFYLIKFIDQFDNENYDLIKRTSHYARRGRDFDELIKNLNRLKLTGDVQQSSVYACEIFIESVFNDFYYASIMQKEIIEFVEFFYMQETPILKKHSNKICNKFAENGQYFLRDLYEKYN